MKVNILSLGLTAPGLNNFEHLKTCVTTQQNPDVSQPIEKYSPSFLPANERRRTTATIKLALKTAEEAWNIYQNTVTNAVRQIPVLFVSKDGDSFIASNMCQALSDENPMISPTQFHNSVHNASVGYWMIGQNNQAPASAISAGKFTIGNGLLEAVLQSQEAKKPVLVVFYDLPVDEVIQRADSSIVGGQLPFAFAMVLEATPSSIVNSYPTFSLSMTQDVSDFDVEYNPYRGVPAAEAYPFLKAVAKLSVEHLERDGFEICFPLSEQCTIKVVLSGES